MFGMTQPEVVETANQPDIAAEMHGKVSEDVGSEPFLTVRYNKEDRALDRDAAKTYAQKGMNYDKLSEKLETVNAKLAEYENGNLNRFVSEYAEQSGMPIESVREVLRYQMEVGMDANAVRQASVDAQLGDFMDRNPDVDPRELPEEVLDAWRSGIPLGEAVTVFEAHKQIRDLQQRIDEMQANADNAAASMGRPQSYGDTHEKALSAETIRNMSSKELEKNHERIWAYLTGEKRQ